MSTKVVEGQSEDGHWQQDQIYEETPELVQDPHNHFIGYEPGRLVQIGADFLHFLEGCGLVGVGMHEFTPLSCKRIRIDWCLMMGTAIAQA